MNRAELSVFECVADASGVTVRLGTGGGEAVFHLGAEAAIVAGYGLLEMNDGDVAYVPASGPFRLEVYPTLADAQRCGEGLRRAGEESRRLARSPGGAELRRAAGALAEAARALWEASGGR